MPSHRCRRGAVSARAQAQRSGRASARGRSAGRARCGEDDPCRTRYPRQRDPVCERRRQRRRENSMERARGDARNSRRSWRTPAETSSSSMLRAGGAVVRVSFPAPASARCATRRSSANASASKAYEGSRLASSGDRDDHRSVGAVIRAKGVDAPVAPFAKKSVPTQCLRGTGTCSAPSWLELACPRRS